ncbi:DUF4035 domain-containing protein [Paraburkholderia panacisoli]|uniref:DUF4035 domain-containing protein n=1 Tax=Paraburkholderia panacisoli TaxID=2603818 RepID=UPI001FE33B9E|nr:DUF4035 domain-containing protein [Paraburkholderia panacisoli]
MRQLLANLDSAELTEWLAYDRIDPFGQSRADLRAGIVAATVANYGNRELRERAKPSNFMAFIEREPERPILLPDSEAQSALILSAVFNRKAA